MRLRQRGVMPVDASELHVVGLDVSLRAPGMAIVSGLPRSKVGEKLVVDSATIRVGKTLEGPERLSVVSNSIWNWLASRRATGVGQLYVMEGYAFSRQAAHSMGEIGGCVRKMIYESGGNLIVVPPNVLKKYATGKGAGEKSAVIKHVDKKWKFDVDDDNQCDAFVCAILGLVDAVLMPVEVTGIEYDILTDKVLRYAGKGQAWGGGVARVSKRSAASTHQAGNALRRGRS